MSNRYSIGQVLYIVSTAHQKIFPVQVREIHQKQTFEGNSTIFMVADPKETNLFNLEELDGTVFIQPNEVASYLKQNIEKSVNAMVDKAVDIAKTCFSSVKTEVPETIPIKKQDMVQKQKQSSVNTELQPGPNEAEIMLPNGRLTKTKVNVKVSPIKQ